MVDNGRRIVYNRYKKLRRKQVFPMAVNPRQAEQLLFQPNPEAKESLSQFLKGLGAESRLGYSLVGMLDEEPNYED